MPSGSATGIVKRSDCAFVVMDKIVHRRCPGVTAAAAISTPHAGSWISPLRQEETPLRGTCDDFRQVSRFLLSRDDSVNDGETLLSLTLAGHRVKVLIPANSRVPTLLGPM